MAFSPKPTKQEGASVIDRPPIQKPFRKLRPGTEIVSGIQEEFMISLSQEDLILFIEQKIREGLKGSTPKDWGHSILGFYIFFSRIPGPSGGYKFSVPFEEVSKQSFSKMLAEHITYTNGFFKDIGDNFEGNVKMRITEIYEESIKNLPGVS